MQNYLRSKAMRRVAALSAAAVIVIAVAVTVTIWRYGAALDESERALDTAGDARNTAVLVSSFWHEREAMNEYLLSPTPDLREGDHTQGRVPARPAPLPGLRS